MKASLPGRSFGLGLCLAVVGLTVAACNTTKATIDTTVNFFSSTTPNDLFSADGMVLKEQKINLFAGVAYQNLREEAAAGGGQYVSSLADLYQIPTAKHRHFAQVLQSRYSDLFTAELTEDRTAHLKMVKALNRELAAASLVP